MKLIFFIFLIGKNIFGLLSKAIIILKLCDQFGFPISKVVASCNLFKVKINMKCMLSPFEILELYNNGHGALTAMNVPIRGCQRCNIVLQSTLNCLNLEWQLVEHLG